MYIFTICMYSSLHNQKYVFNHLWAIVFASIVSILRPSYILLILQLLLSFDYLLTAIKVKFGARLNDIPVFIYSHFKTFYIFLKLRLTQIVCLYKNTYNYSGRSECSHADSMTGLHWEIVTYPRAYLYEGFGISRQRTKWRPIYNRIVIKNHWISNIQ